jgi:hypothetical protein
MYLATLGVNIQVVGVINNPGLRDIAFKIVSDPDFRTDQQGMRRALRQWFEAVTSQQREAAEQAFVIRWLEDVRAEFLREQGAARRTPAVAGAEMPKIVAGHLDEDDVVRETPQPASELKFQSVSPEWQRPRELREPEPGPAAADPRKRADASRPPSPVTITRQPVPVQQPSRKVASYRQMFPELAFPVQTASGPKPLAEFGAGDIEFRVGELGRQRSAWRTANAGDESRNDDLARRLDQGRARVAERAQNIRDAEGEARRLEAGAREMAEHGVTALGELPADVLAKCGFRRRVA